MDRSIRSAHAGAALSAGAWRAPGIPPRHARPTLLQRLFSRGERAQARTTAARALAARTKAGCSCCAVAGRSSRPRAKSPGAAPLIERQRALCNCMCAAPARARLRATRSCRPAGATVYAARRDSHLPHEETAHAGRRHASLVPPESLDGYTDKQIEGVAHRDDVITDVAAGQAMKCAASACSQLTELRAAGRRLEADIVSTARGIRWHRQRRQHVVCATGEASADCSGRKACAAAPGTPTTC